MKQIYLRLELSTFQCIPVSVHTITVTIGGLECAKGVGNCQLDLSYNGMHIPSNNKKPYKLQSRTKFGLESKSPDFSGRMVHLPGSRQGRCKTQRSWDTRCSLFPARTFALSPAILYPLVSYCWTSIRSSSLCSSSGVCSPGIKFYRKKIKRFRRLRVAWSKVNIVLTITNNNVSTFYRPIDLKHEIV